MSAELLNATVAQARASFTSAEVRTVQPYAGEFNAVEVGQVSFACPALLVTVLGWQPENDPNVRIAGRHLRRVRMATFVVTKHPEREKRLEQAMAIAHKLCLALKLWKPASLVTQATAIAPLEDEPSAENLFGRAIDAKGLALWLVSWDQHVSAQVPLEQLVDLVRIEITDDTVQGNLPPPPPAAGSLTVEQDVRFKPLPFNA